MRIRLIRLIRGRKESISSGVLPSRQRFGSRALIRGRCPPVTQSSGSVEKHGGRNSTKGVIHHLVTANVYDGGCKRLRERMQTFAVKRGSALQGQMQCTARADAVHCGDGCSALRLRWVKLAPKSPVLFWIREKGGKMHL